MSAIAGKGGFVKINTNVIGEVQTWSCDIGTNVIDTTAIYRFHGGRSVCVYRLRLCRIGLVLCYR